MGITLLSGITAILGNLASGGLAPEVVAGHRARGQLRTRLEQTCQLCATHGCLDCDCAPSS